MCNEAVQLVDRVFPNVPIRQWVVSLPWELRRLAATKRGVLGAMDRIFAEEIARLTRRLAGVADAQAGSVGCPRMFGGSLNLHPHLHTLAVDGVFEKTDGGGVRFHEAPAPSKDDVSEVAKRVRERAVRWLRRHGYVDQRAAEELSGSLAEAVCGAATVVLAIIALTGTLPGELASFATIVFGAALIAHGGAIAARFRELTPLFIVSTSRCTHSTWSATPIRPRS
jgi:hypothetical protein